MKHICIFTQSPLTKAPRVVKEANVYAKAGHNVTVYGLWYHKEIVEADLKLLHSKVKYKPGILLFPVKSLKSQLIRFKRRIGRELVRYGNIQNTYSLGYDHKSYLRKLELERADLYIGHEELSMALAKSLIEKGKKVAFDFEDWHSKDLLPKDRKYRPIKLLESLEAFILKNATYCYTTSEALAENMANYHASNIPEVIYNSFPAEDRERCDGFNKDIKYENTPSLYWFSQMISEGRGLESFFEGLRWVKTPFQLHLRGNVNQSYKEYLFSIVPPHIKLYVHDLVPHNELISRISEHSLGLAIEENTPESRNCTITNKVFHYLQAGIPILATETAGQLELANKFPDAIKIVNREPVEIAKTLDYLFSNSSILGEMQKASWEAGNDISFENQSKKLLDFVNKVMQ
ncbi:hypothetical protein GCM10028791_39060 [Echinicola sediminis]